MLSGINPDHRHQSEILALLKNCEDSEFNTKGYFIFNNISNFFATRRCLNNKTRMVALAIISKAQILKLARNASVWSLALAGTSRLAARESRKAKYPAG